MIECPLKAAARDDARLPALEAPDRSFTYGELDRLVDGTAAQLASLGNRVAFQLENGWRAVVLLLAGLRAGVTICPISTRLPEKAAKEQMRSIGATPLGILAFEDGDGDANFLIPADAPATIVFTSGSSGRPKAALHSFENHYFSAAGSNENIEVGPGDRWLLTLPLYHVGGIGILFRCLLGRGTVILPKKQTPLEAAVRESVATHASMVATQLSRFLADPVRGMKAILLGGSAIPRELIAKSVEAGLPIHTSYGLTETASQVTTTAPGAGIGELETSGRVLPHREIRISERGEILVRGRTRFQGYVEGERLEAPFDAEGWFATRDLGMLEDGLLRVSGRLDNMFISGGENVMPEEIEAALEQFPEVARAVVVPVADDEFGERPVAFLDTAEDFDEARIRAKLAEIVPRFKIPVRFFPWPDRDESAAMKIERSFFRRRADKLMSERP